MKTQLYIEALLKFGLHNGMIETLDLPQVRNQLMHLLGIKEPFAGDVSELESLLPLTQEEIPTLILEILLEEAVSRGIIGDSLTEAEILDAKIMAQLMPRQSELNRMFQSIKTQEGVEAATDFFYHISKASNYIRMDRIAKNEYWVSTTPYGELEITINLSKPEKDPKEIAKAKEMPQSNYPKCLLCLENVGYEGHFNHPARSNHRVLPVTLMGESWYFQYSPYVYYNEHAIIFKEQHEPMKVSRESFSRLLGFVEQYPHYFVGSNADLPIVGGSILSHDHFQGGHHRFPMVDAKVIKRYSHDDYKNVQIEVVEWPLSVLRIGSESIDALVDFGDKVLVAWREYSDASVGIFAYSDGLPHNTITPIARRNDQGLYELDLVLRNNRTSDAHPDGIYHPHAHLHHIKKENIGLIEVMGLAVLPARLKEELALIVELLTGGNKDFKLSAELEKHRAWIESLVEQHGVELEAEAADALIRQEVGRIFGEVLACAGVYKLDEEGLKAFDVFVVSLGCK
jgi:UDPglucose--hexose-1-phosphate uridylyltransferase